MNVSTQQEDSEIDLVLEQRPRCKIDALSFRDRREWHLGETATVLGSRTDALSPGSRQYRLVGACCVVTRIPTYFVFNIFLIMVI